MSEVVDGEVYNPPENGQASIEEEEVPVSEVVDEVSDEWQMVAESNSKTEEVPKKSYAYIVSIRQSKFYPFSLLIHQVCGFIGSYSSCNFYVLDVGRSYIFYFNLLLQVKVMKESPAAPTYAPRRSVSKSQEQPVIAGPPPSPLVSETPVSSTNANENSSNKDSEGVQFVIVDFYFC